MIGDRDLRDPPGDCLGTVGIDRDVGVGREVRVQVRVERQVAVGIGPGRRKNGGQRGGPHVGDSSVHRPRA
jgi:hypothetical protein